MPFSNAEFYDMLAVYFQSFENACIAEREYAIRYPDRERVSRKVFKRLAVRLRETGNVHPAPAAVRRRRIRHEDNIINVLAYVEANPNSSIRDISRDLAISKTSVQKILIDHKLHPYHLVIHQSLSEADFDHRLNFCNWLSNMCNENHQFLSHILWTDEATFTNAGGVNLHNMHYWSAENPHWMRETDFQNRWSVNVWCGIVGNKIIGPFIFDGRLNGATYLEFLRNQLPILLEDVPLETRRNLWFQQDGCPAHYSREVQEFLNLQFPYRWIGRGSLFPWPARSPDLTPPDFYLWGRIKEIVYQVKPTTPENMVERIRNAVDTISPAEIEAAIASTRRRIDSCVANNGMHFEHLR